MNADNLELLERHLGTIPVPRFDFAAIVSRAAHRPESRIRRRIVTVAVLFILLPALAAAAVHYFPVKVEQTRSGSLVIVSDTLTVSWRARPTDLRRIARGLPYRVVWPTGLPQNVNLRTASSADSQVAIVEYRCRNNRFAQFIIMPKQMRVVRAPKQLAGIRVNLAWMKRQFNWTAGEEQVRVQTNCLSDTDVARIRAAMVAAGRAKR
ncbi:MAG TPA: hypothetical protein VKT72_17680 [Candidatus Baltobacteraceae bacterium]|nr:hypothetical protein [Candidatus Baltobacteraceae bacterium]